MEIDSHQVALAMAQELGEDETGGVVSGVQLGAGLGGMIGRNGWNLCSRNFQNSGSFTFCLSSAQLSCQRSSLHPPSGCSTHKSRSPGLSLSQKSVHSRKSRAEGPESSFVFPQILWVDLQPPAWRSDRPNLSLGGWQVSWPGCGLGAWSSLRCHRMRHCF